MKKRIAFVGVFLLLMTLLFGGCQKEQEPLGKTEFLMDTVCTVTLYDTTDEALLEEAFDLCREYEALLSRTVEGSDIYKLNLIGDGSLLVSEPTADLLRLAQKYTEHTGGKFDVTVGRLTALWDFKAEEPVLPDENKMEEALSKTGYENLTVDGNTVTVRGGVKLDLGGIAKGYVADRCAEFLKGNGVTRGIINFGGNVVVIGSKGEDTPWTVGIQRPFADHSEIIGTAMVSDCSVVTSGVYERFFELDGTVFHHILDPQTGYPVQNDLESVTIFAPSSAEADALSTSAFLLGEEKALELVESLPEVEAVFIDDKGEITASSGIGTRIPFEKTA